jgi:hypothetical protein
VAKIGGLRLSSPATNGDTDGARAFRGQLKPARCRHREASDLGYDSAEATMAQALLETGQDRFLVAGLDIDQSAQRQAGLGEGGREEILPDDAPQDFPFGPGRDSCRKESRRRTVDRTIAAAGHLVQGADRKTTFRQNPVYLRDTEREHRSARPSPALEASDACAKLGKG